MIYDLLPFPIKVLYLKMKTAKSLQGYLNALRELLNELEYINETKKPFAHLKNLLSFQERLWQKEFDNVAHWIVKILTKVKKAKYPFTEKIKAFIEKEELAIKNGTVDVFKGRSYLEMQFKLLESVAGTIAAYGDDTALKDWCHPIQETMTVHSYEVEPLVGEVISGIILPGTKQGDILEKKLKHGFISIEVINRPGFLSKRQLDLPNDELLIEYSKTTYERLYYVKKGKVDINFSKEVEAYRNLIFGRRSSEIFDSRPVLLLHELQTYAYWRDWMNEDNKFPEKATQNDLKIFYNQMAMKGQLLLAFNLKSTPEIIRKHLQSTLDRFLVHILSEVHQSSLGNKERAIKYAYSKVKDRLCGVIESKRSVYTYDEISTQILNEAKLEELPYKIELEHCTQACKKFAKEYGWKPIRKSAQKKRVSPTSK